ncbi:tRNA uracil 4-sulfurtransferase ThiI [Sansalvadorimonas verongulae]|uniref:tRNA uracil 4-sulfurtransferase ThiI n=1 Tax=Sansalvadorimonas verongulae TaxID=2172824 RepID=UPI0012BD69C8|nr:tRNA uracil 4-sulfurtransferase ThiI [Sansalvadorimonas verongulae]MTI13600.1 tRNA 4-thiouridine(8) synthase ThiI [Sansalvadorimonas verongulae]
MKFIIKLFPEITIKSAPVRKQLVKQLRRNIRTVCRSVDESLEVTGKWDMIEAESSLTDPADIATVADRLQCIPGIHQALEVAEYPLTTLDDMLAIVKPQFEAQLAGKTFCVRVKRTGSHDFSSNEVERYIGGELNQNTEAAGVKLKNPDVKVEMEIKHDRWFLITKRHQGMGGYPIGSQDPVLSLISGGFDSTVSSFLTMKRGLNTHFCFFNLGGHAHELAVKEVAYYLWSRYGASHRVRFVTIPFEGVVEEILTKIDNSYMGVILKRMMLRAACKTAELMDIQAIVTGESVAQVSSQTLTNLAVIDSVTDRLVFRPLATMDKGEIISTAARIGTEEFARNIPEYCAVISKKPTTKAKREKVEKEETFFDFGVLDAAVESRRSVSIADIIADDLTREQVEVVDKIATDDVIIDIRHPTEEELKPLVMEDREIQVIPFYQLMTRFPELDRECHYLLYCDKGVMSQLHAMHLRDEGFSNVAVFQPKDR